MDLLFQNGQAEWTADILLAPLCEEPSSVFTLSAYPELDTLCPWLAVAPAMRDLSLAKGDLTIVHGHPELAVSRVLFIGLGKKEEFSLHRFRKNLAKAMKKVQDLHLKSALIPVPLLSLLPFGKMRLAAEAVYACELALFDGGLFKKSDPEKARAPERLCLGLTQKDPHVEAESTKGQRNARAHILARTLANTPANHLTPALLSEKAASLAQTYGFSHRELNEDELKKEGMGALLAVGQGSCHPPRLIVLEYSHEEHSADKPLILVGKGICFDSGGISLKPSAKMEQMKSDMSGAAAVLAAMTVIAEEKLPKHVVGLLACAENMPGGRATRPGDVVRALNGESIEITNTDAEGRLVLADALLYAQKYYTPCAMVDIATLTGACSVALGDEIAGLFCDNESLAEHLSASGTTSGEPLWRLPFWQSYAKKLKSEVADICHTGPREGGAINAALFLKHFVNNTPFAHLDIAGVDFKEKADPLCPKGATGFGTRTLIELARGGLE